MQNLKPLVLPLLALLYFFGYEDYILPVFIGLVVLTASLELWKVVCSWWQSYRDAARIRGHRRKEEREKRIQRQHQIELAKHYAKQPPPPSPEEHARAKLLVIKTLHDQKVNRILSSGMSQDAIQAAMDVENRRFEREIGSAFST